MKEIRTSRLCVQDSGGVALRLAKGARLGRHAMPAECARYPRGSLDFARPDRRRNKLARGCRRNGFWPGCDRIAADRNPMALIGWCRARWKGRTNHRTRVTRSTSDQNRHEEVNPSAREGL